MMICKNCGQAKTNWMSPLCLGKSGSDAAHEFVNDPCIVDKRLPETPNAPKTQLDFSDTFPSKEDQILSKLDDLQKDVTAVIEWINKFIRENK